MADIPGVAASAGRGEGSMRCDEGDARVRVSVYDTGINCNPPRWR